MNTTPAEPEDGAVVLDKDSAAWQRAGDRWLCACCRASRTWIELSAEYGPLEVIEETAWIVFAVLAHGDERNQPKEEL